MEKAAYAVLILCLSPAAGCSSAPEADDDCSARVRFGHTIYRPHNALRESPLHGRSLGTGDIIDCGGMDATAVDEVKVYAVKGVDPAIAVMTVGGTWRGVYVAEGLRRSSWPTPLRKR